MRERRVHADEQVHGGVSEGAGGDVVACPRPRAEVRERLGEHTAAPKEGLARFKALWREHGAGRQLAWTPRRALRRQRRGTRGSALLNAGLVHPHGVLDQLVSHACTSSESRSRFSLDVSRHGRGSLTPSSHGEPGGSLPSWLEAAAAATRAAAIMSGWSGLGAARALRRSGACSTGRVPRASGM